MPSHFRTLSLALATTAATLAACAGAPTESATDADAQRAAAELNQVADSLTRAGADASVAGAYRSLAILVRAGHFTAVTISVDGAPTAFLATAHDVEFDPSGSCGAQLGSLCLLAPPLRSMMAIDRANPRRVVQLTTPGAGVALGAPPPGGTAAPFLNAATLTYFDGAGGVFIGAGGGQSISDPVKSDTPCYQGNYPTVSWAGACTLAQYTVSFSGTVGPLALLFPTTITPATGTHTLSMAPQTVDGTRTVIPPNACALFCGGTSYPPGLLPPIDLRGVALPAGLSAAVGASGVTFTFTVSNPQSSPVTLQFNSGQQYDFRVDTPDGANVWTWSTGRGFVTMLTSRTIAANGEVAYVEQWIPPRSGTYFVKAFLTSSSHHAGAAVSFAVP